MPQCDKCSYEDNDKDKQDNNLFCQIEYETFCMPCYYKEINNESEETKYKYKVTCPAIGYEDTIEHINSDSAELSALTDIGMNIHEYIEVDVEKITK